MATSDGLIPPESSDGTARKRNRRQQKLPTAHEVSAGGLLVDGIDSGPDGLRAVLIGRLDPQGALRWSFPTGHVEPGERLEEAATREVFEETGFRGVPLAALGTFDYWFLAENRRVHKLVHHYLLRHTGGRLSVADHEVADVAWFPFEDLASVLVYQQERELAAAARSLVALLHREGLAGLPALPTNTPRRRRQTHSRARRHGGA